MFHETIPLLRDFVVRAVLSCGIKKLQSSISTSFWQSLTVGHHLEAELKVKNFRDRFNQVHRVSFPLLISLINNCFFSFFLLPVSRETRNIESEIDGTAPLQSYRTEIEMYCAEGFCWSHSSSLTVTLSFGRGGGWSQSQARDTNQDYVQNETRK